MRILSEARTLTSFPLEPRRKRARFRSRHDRDPTRGPGKEGAMVWLWIVIGIVVVLAILWLVFRKPLMERRDVRRRAIAAELRRQADSRSLQAQQHDAVAQREAELAQSQRD